MQERSAKQQLPDHDDVFTDPETQLGSSAHRPGTLIGMLEPIPRAQPTIREPVLIVPVYHG